MPDHPCVIVWRETTEKDGDHYLIGQTPGIHQPPYRYIGIEFEIPLDENPILLSVTTKAADFAGEISCGKNIFSVECASATIAQEISEFIARRMLDVFSDLENLFPPARETTQNDLRTPRI